MASGLLPDSSRGHGDGSAQHSGKHDTEHDDVGANAKRLHFSGYDENLPHGGVDSQTPVEEVFDDTTVEQMMSP